MPLLITILILAACSRATMGEVIEKDIPFNVKEIIHKERVKKGVILLYVTSQKNNQGEFDTVTVAFLKGNDQDGWENAGHNHWEHEEDNLITVYQDVFYDYDHKGHLENRLPVIYGKIESDGIRSVKLYSEDGKLEQAKIIEKKSGRYYMKIGDYAITKGIK
ncbi:hypothetical protein F7731_02260 [Cytobacillus depressus]|uniref:Uncharacterized protein n=2 Tax=Cytobacillus depressus TaxID=1602942 RepID=A0A6L3VBC8_9BACI|nr:hypothetical protein F7731_02260 [Cytobacillus depressus]